MPAWLVSGESPSWLADDCLLAVSSHGLSSVCIESTGVSSSDQNTSSVSLLLRPHFTLITSLKALSPKTVTLGISASIYEAGGGGGTIQSITGSLRFGQFCLPQGKEGCVFS